MQQDQEPHRSPKWGRKHNVAVVQEQQDLEDGRRDLVPLAVPQVARKVAHKRLVEAVVETLGLHPDREDEVLCRGCVRPECVPVGGAKKEGGETSQLM